jgi:hypothetical protein
MDRAKHPEARVRVAITAFTRMMKMIGECIMRSMIVGEGSMP